MVAVNDICTYFPANAPSVLYVDDYAMFASGSMPHMIERKLQTAINRLQEWGNRTGFTFST